MGKHHFKTYASKVLKTAKISSEIEHQLSPWELNVNCITYWYLTKRAKKRFDGDIGSAQKWLEDNFFSSGKFSILFNENSNENYTMNSICGFSFSCDSSIKSFNNFEKKTNSVVSASLMVHISDKIRNELDANPEKLYPHIDRIYKIVDKTFSTITKQADNNFYLFYPRTKLKELIGK